MNYQSTNDEWFAQRLGRFTASRFGDLMTNGKAKDTIGQTAKSYIIEVAYEQITGVPQGFTGNAATEWGNTYEDEARTEYEAVTGRKVEQVGFCSHPTNRYVGGSPDGLVDSDGIQEIKCPANGMNHVKNVLEDAFVKEYEWQCQGNMWVTGRKWCDLVSYDPRLKGLGKHIHIVRIERDEEKIAQLEARVEMCVGILKEYLVLLGGEEEMPF